MAFRGDKVKSFGVVGVTLAHPAPVGYGGRSHLAGIIVLSILYRGLIRSKDKFLTIWIIPKMAAEGCLIGLSHKSGTWLVQGDLRHLGQVWAGSLGLSYDSGVLRIVTLD